MSVNTKVVASSLMSLVAPAPGAGAEILVCVPSFNIVKMFVASSWKRWEAALYVRASVSVLKLLIVPEIKSVAYTSPLP